MTALMARYPDFYRGSGEFVDMQQALEPEVLPCGRPGTG